MLGSMLQRQCGYFDFNVSRDNLHWKLRREVQYNYVKKVNAFIVKIKWIRDDEIKAYHDEELDENKLEINEDLDQRERKLKR